MIGTEPCWAAGSRELKSPDNLWDAPPALAAHQASGLVELGCSLFLKVEQDLFSGVFFLKSGGNCKDTCSYLWFSDSDTFNDSRGAAAQCCSSPSTRRRQGLAAAALPLLLPLVSVLL